MRKMKLKCIGGLANGEIIEVTDFREFDHIRVPAKVTFSLESFEEELMAFRENRVPESMINYYHIYQVGCIHWIDEHKTKSSLYYLHPIKWNKFEALVYAIGA